MAWKSPTTRDVPQEAAGKTREADQEAAGKTTARKIRPTKDGYQEVGGMFEAGRKPPRHSASSLSDGSTPASSLGLSRPLQLPLQASPSPSSPSSTPATNGAPSLEPTSSPAQVLKRGGSREP